jgi:hypothetical protein
MSSSHPSGDQNQIGSARIEAEKAISLFEFYENKGMQDKQNMITFTTWLSPVIFTLIGYWISVYDHGGLKGIFASVATVLSSTYAVYIIREFADHANENYRRAELVKELTHDQAVKDLLFLERGADYDKNSQAKPSFVTLLLDLKRVQIVDLRNNLQLEFVSDVFLVLLLAARLLWWFSLIMFAVSTGYFVVAWLC